MIYNERWYPPELIQILNLYFEHLETNMTSFRTFPPSFKVLIIMTIKNFRSYNIVDRIRNYCV